MFWNFLRTFQKIKGYRQIGVKEPIQYRQIVVKTPIQYRKIDVKIPIRYRQIDTFKKLLPGPDNSIVLIFAIYVSENFQQIK